tara:strand:- start:455 stop:583 length:129 start_codon:yes stop_codon:yes gene_type:complete
MTGVPPWKLILALLATFEGTISIFWFDMIYFYDLLDIKMQEK